MYTADGMSHILILSINAPAVMHDDSTPLVTMFLMIPVASGMLNPLDRIHEYLILTAPTVLNATTIF